jgi:hypothetical protein
LTKYADFDALVSESKIAKIGGREWDLSRVPFEVYLSLLKSIQDADGNPISPIVYRDALKMWLKDLDPALPDGWVESHVDARMMIHIQRSVFDGIYSDPLVTFQSPEETVTPNPSKKQSQISSLPSA